MLCTLGEAVTTATAGRTGSKAEGDETKFGVEGERNEYPSRRTHPL